MNTKQQISKLKQNLQQHNALSVLYGIGVLVIIVLFMAVYRPLLIKLKVAENHFNSLEAQLLSQRQRTEILKKMDLQPKAMQQKEVPQAIDQITEKGRSLGLKFISITPAELQETSLAKVKKLPINFSIASEYKSLGQFLAYLESFPHSVIEVKSLSLRPGKEILPQLEAQLMVNLYLEGENAR